MTISIEELKAMGDSMVPSEHRKTIGEVVNVMMTLRTMDMEVIDSMLTLHDLALPHMPEALQPAFVGMITDLKLVKVFAEQAKFYNKVEEGEKAFECVFGKILPDGPKTS